MAQPTGLHQLLAGVFQHPAHLVCRIRRDSDSRFIGVLRAKQFISELSFIIHDFLHRVKPLKRKLNVTKCKKFTFNLRFNGLTRCRKIMYNKEKSLMNCFAPEDAE